jgi:lipopolysaccharide export system protein LptC
MKRLLLILLLALMCGLAYWYGTSQMEKRQKVGVQVDRIQKRFRRSLEPSGP